jgi:hypothetical protein
MIGDNGGMINAQEGANLFQQNCDPVDENDDCTTGFESQPFPLLTGCFSA